MSEQIRSSTHPLLPPTTEDERLSWLRLLRSRRVGVSTFYRLMAEHGSALAALRVLPRVAAQAGMSKYEAFSEQAAHAELRSGHDIGARLICRGEPGYPALLAEISDAPPMIWQRGNADVLGKPLIALVGARNASSLGTRMTRTLAGELAEAGFAVVSGLARGVDTCAHLASLETGTVGVLAGGIDVIYPAENTNLAHELLAQGSLISEQPVGMAPIARHFPMRNRIISGLCKATIVIEAASRSGSLITARGALDQGRDVFAVPGHPFDARAAGCNMLIRDGATLVRSAADVIEALDEPEPQQAPQLAMDLAEAAKPDPVRSLRDVNALHQRILDRLGPSPIAEDQLLRDVGAGTRTVIPVLTDLELSGKILRAPGGMISRA